MRYIKSRINISQILLTLEDTEQRRRALNAKRTFDNLFHLGFVPIVNENDSIATSEIKYGDNDRLASRVAQISGADSLILLSDVDGLYTQNPKIDKNAKLLKEIKNIDIVELRRQPKFIDDLKNPFVNFLENYRDSKNFFILLPERWDFYKNNFLKKEFHSQNMRKKRSLKKLGKLQFEVYKDRDGKIQVLDKLFIQKNSRLKKLGIKELFESTDINFYKKISSENYDQNNVHVCALKLNGKLIAMHWGMIYKKRFYYLLLSMQEEELGRLSPGRILINLMIKWSIAKKLKFFDFTLGQEAYKESWSNNESYLYNFISIKSTKGIFFFLLLKIKYFLKHIDKKNTILKILLKLKKF